MKSESGLRVGSLASKSGVDTLEAPQLHPGEFARKARYGVAKFEEQPPVAET